MKTKSDREKKIREICTYESEEDEVGGGHTCGYCLSEEQFKKLFTLVQQAKQEGIDEAIGALKLKKQEFEDWFGDQIGYNNAVKLLDKKISELKKKEGI